MSLRRSGCWVLLWAVASCGAGSDPGANGGDGGSTSPSRADTGSMQETGNTGGDDTDTGGSDSDTGSGAMGPYSAIVVPGDPSVLRVKMASVEEGRCFWIELTDQEIGLLAITTPDGWRARTAYTNEREDACAEDDPAVRGLSQVSSAQGSIAAGEGDLGERAPCTLDVDVELTFRGLGIVTTFAAVGVPVDGC